MNAINAANWDYSGQSPARIQEIKTVLAVPEFQELCRRLLKLGGDRVVPVPDGHLQQLNTRGRVFNEPAKRVKGAPSSCHTNAARLWLRRADGTAKIVTGWALSADGLWRQHSWAVVDGTLHETTVRREQYFGFDLSAEEAVIFALGNLPHDQLSDREKQTMRERVQRSPSAIAYLSDAARSAKP